MNMLSTKLSKIIALYTAQGYDFNEGASQNELEDFVSRCKNTLDFLPPEDHLKVLEQHNGIVVEGVFLYSTTPIKYTDSDGYCLEFMEMNLISRELEWKDTFIIFGDSDQDEYVLDLTAGRYQVRDKQAFDNVYEELGTFTELLEYMLDLMISRIE
ncbi:YrhA family protein [Pseudomonas viridiflava]|uniref:YrhA family protein n=1 Tax=Pseudomonas viridiflava TaxID=33069 RepID=UPI000F04A8F9|nr:YrhA family protein [Pseudomonas viridiflava]